MNEAKNGERNLCPTLANFPNINGQITAIFNS